MAQGEEVVDQVEVEDEVINPMYSTLFSRCFKVQWVVVVEEEDIKHQGVVEVASTQIEVEECFTMQIIRI
jgi:hypothetical protein